MSTNIDHVIRAYRSRGTGLKVDPTDLHYNTLTLETQIEHLNIERSQKTELIDQLKRMIAALKTREHQSETRLKQSQVIETRYHAILEENKTLYTQQAVQKQKISSLETEVKKCRENEGDDVETLRTEKQQLEERVAQLEQDIQLSQQKETDLVTRLQTNLQTSQDEMTELKKEVGTLQQQEIDFMTQVTQLQHELTTAQMDKETFQQSLERLKNDIQTHQNTITQEKTTAQTLQANNTDLQKQVQSLRELLDQANSQTETLQKSKKDTTDELKKEKNKAVNALDTLKKEIAQKLHLGDVERDQFTEVVVQSYKKVVDERDQQKERADQLDTQLKASESTSTTKISELEAQLKSSETQTRELTAKLDIWVQDTSDVFKQLSKFTHHTEHELDKSKRLVEEFRPVIDFVQTLIDDNESHKTNAKELQDQDKVLRATITDLQEQQKHLEDQKLRLQSKIEELRQTVKTLQGQEQAARNEIDALKQAHSSDAQRFEEEAKQKEEQNTILQNSLEELNDRFMESQTKLEETIGKNEEWKAKYNTDSEQAKQFIATLEDQLAERSQRLHEVTNQAGAGQATNQVLINERAQLQQRCVLLEQQLAGNMQVLAQQQQRLESQDQTYQQQLQYIQQQLQYIQQLENKLQELVEILRRKEEEYSSNMDAAVAGLEDSVKEKKAHEQQLEQMHAASDKLQIEKNELNQRIQELMGEGNILMETHKELEQKHRQLVADHAEVQETNERILHEYNTKSTEFEQRLRQMEQTFESEFQTEIAKAEEESRGKFERELDGMKAQYQAAFDSFQQEKQRLELEQHDITTAVDDIRARLTEKEHELKQQTQQLERTKRQVKQLEAQLQAKPEFPSDIVDEMRQLFTRESDSLLYFNAFFQLTTPQ